MAIKYYTVQPFSSLREMLELAKNESGEKVAYMFKNKAKEVCERTYAEFYEDVYSLGTALADLGISKKNVACIGENGSLSEDGFAMLASVGLVANEERTVPITRADAAELLYTLIMRP